jgi:hypothetical protein
LRCTTARSAASAATSGSHACPTASSSSSIINANG